MIWHQILGQYCLAVMLAILSAASVAEIHITDDLGREITLASPARRIVSLAPHNTENLFTAGAGEFIVGTVDYSDFPAKALDIPRIGGYKKINIEAVIAAKPDLVVAWSSGNPSAPVQRLIDFGIPVFYSEPGTFEKIISNIERFSLIADTQALAAPRLDEMRQTLAALQQQYSQQAPVSVFYQVWNQPLITLNGEHSVSHAFKICGATNVFNDEPTIAPRINIEGVIASNPQLIILAGHTQAQAREWGQMWKQWPAIDAVKNGAISFIESDIINRPTKRFIMGTQQICQLIDEARKNLNKP